MNYPEKLIAFMKAATPKDKGFFTKALKNNTKFQKELQSLFNRLHFPDNIPNDEKYYLIANNLTEQPKCIVCGNSSVFANGSYKEYCSQKCYLQNIGGDNNPAAKEISINGKIFSSIAKAEAESGLSRYLIIENCFGEIDGFRFHPDHENQRQEMFSKLPAAVKNEQFLLSCKQKRLTISKISELIDVSENDIAKAFKFYKISTKYDQISPESKALLLDKTYVESILEENPIEIAKKLNVSMSSIINYIRFHGFTYANKFKSFEQHRIFRFIESLGFSPLYNLRKKDEYIWPKELDIFIPELNIAFEYNGVYWHKEAEEKHSEKYKMCTEKGIRLYQIFEDDWLENEELIKKKIKHALGVDDSQRIFARKCEVRTLPNSDVRIFYSFNHLYGHKNCKEHLGLFYNDELVACVSFNDYKLERFATSGQVIGGFSKLLKASGKKYVETFADLCWSDANNNVYTKNGFILTHITRPNYFWFYKGKRQSRLAFQKHKLKDFPGYSEEKSESEIMYENGAYRIFDAGHAKLVYNAQ